MSRSLYKPNYCSSVCSVRIIYLALTLLCNVLTGVKLEIAGAARVSPGLEVQISFAEQTASDA